MCNFNYFSAPYKITMNANCRVLCHARSIALRTLIDPLVTIRRMTTRVYFDDIDVGGSWRVVPSFIKSIVFCCKTLLIQIKVQSEEIYVFFLPVMSWRRGLTLQQGKRKWNSTDQHRHGTSSS